MTIRRLGMNPGDFLTELKRRNVYKVAVTYAVVAWLLMQIATQIFPFLEIPNWAIRLVILALVVGFPIALVLAWAYEMTPEGIKTTAGAPVAEGRSSRTWLYVILVAALLSIGLFFLGRYTALTQNKQAGRTTPEKSIAVLPFENLSEDKSNAYFADGIQEEILTRLSKIADLKVISRTSTQKYKSAPNNLREIADELGVANILEGSVQKAPGQVRVSVQLIKAATDSHLWAETYDRKLVDVFQVESDVAQKIAGSLEAKLTGREQSEITAVGTTNAEAYDAYLRGLALSREDNYDSQRQSAEALEQAVQLDPNFAVAWAVLARMRSDGFSQSVERRAATKTALENALRLQPDLAEAQLAKGFYEQRIEHDYDRARETFEQLLNRWPNNADVTEALGLIMVRQGHFKEGRDYLDRAINLNPRDLLLRREAAIVRINMRDFQDALRIFDQALVIWPDSADLVANKAVVYQALGQLDEADKLLATLQPRAKDQDAARIMWYQAVLRRRYPEAIKLFQGFLEPANRLPSGLHGIYLMALGVLQKFNGDAEGAKTSFNGSAQEFSDRLKHEIDGSGGSGFVGMLAQVHAGLDECSTALSEAQGVVDRHPESKDALDGPFYLEIQARIQALCGENDAAIPIIKHLLTASYDGPYGPPLTPAVLRLDPYFDRLRNDPRFQELVAQ